MPLPQQVINQLSQDTPKTPGWSSGVLFFSGAILVVVLAIYFVLIAIYGPHVSSEFSTAQSKIATLDQSIASGDEAQLISFYSEVINVQSLLKNHILFSQFLGWLEQNTEANISYSQFSFSSGGTITLTGSAKSESDINEQVVVFETSPLVRKVSLSNVGITGAGGTWTFNAILIMNPTIFVAPVSTTTTP